MEPESFDSQPLAAPPEEPSVDAVPPRPELWNYWDLAGGLLFAVVAFIVCALTAAVMSAALTNFAGIHAPINEQPYMVYWALGIQALWWALVFAYLYYVVSIKYRLPFWKALGFVPYRVPLVWFVVLGFVLTFAVGVVGQAIGAPDDTSFMDLLSDPNTLWLMGIFAVLIGPVTEEIAFRGFLFRPIAAAQGPLAAILLTTAIFVVMHGSQYDWSWQIMAILFAAGGAFGLVRWLTGSLWPPIAMHMAYNGLQFAAFMFKDQLGLE